MSQAVLTQVSVTKQSKSTVIQAVSLTRDAYESNKLANNDEVSYFNKYVLLYMTNIQ